MAIEGIKTSLLGYADLPLNGAEVVYVVQGGESKQTSIAATRGLRGELRDFLINAGQEINQRGSVSIPAGSFAYTLDQYLVTNDTNQTVVVTRENQSPGSVLVPGNPRYKMRLSFAVAATTGAVRIAQRIKDVYSLQGLNASARAYFTAPTGSEILACEIVQNFGTTGSPSSEVVTPAALLDVETIFDASTQERKAQYTVPTISGKVLGTDNNDYIELAWVLTPRQSGNYEVSRMSFVEGDASAETDPASIRLNELSLCQEYYFQYDGNFFATTHSGTNQMCEFSYPVTMRDNPALSYSISSGAFVADYSTKYGMIIYLAGAGSAISALEASAEL